MTKHMNLPLKYARAYKIPSKKSAFRYFDYVLYVLFLLVLIQQLLG